MTGLSRRRFFVDGRRVESALFPGGGQVFLAGPHQGDFVAAGVFGAVAAVAPDLFREHFPCDGAEPQFAEKFRLSGQGEDPPLGARVSHLGDDGFDDRAPDAQPLKFRSDDQRADFQQIVAEVADRRTAADMPVRFGDEEVV